MNEDLKSIINMSNRFTLSLNPNKSHVLLFGTKPARFRCLHNINLHIDNIKLLLNDSARSLSLTMDSS